MGQLIIRDGMEIEQSQKENKRRDFEIITVSEFVEDLKKQGYDIKINAQIKGKSGLVHQVDGLAIHAKNGNRIIVWLEKRGDTTTEIIQIFAIAYDSGAEACYVVNKELNEEDRKLAEFYKMKLLAKG